MKKLSEKQLSRAAEISGNISVAWFSAGAISPLVSRPKSIFEFALNLAVSLIMAGIFFVIALQLEKSQK